MAVLSKKRDSRVEGKGEGGTDENLFKDAR
jgi:hypothetical protein